MELKQFGSRLKELRLKNDLTKEQLGKELVLTHTTISYYESEKRNPSIRIIERIADYFSVSVDYLLGKTNITYRYPDLNLMNVIIAKDYYQSYFAISYQDDKQRDEILEILGKTDSTIVAGVLTAKGFLCSNIESEYVLE